MNFRVIAIPVLISLVGSHCSLNYSAIERKDNVIVLLDPAEPLGEKWEHQRLRKKPTLYNRVETNLGATLRATGQGSASILYRLMNPVSLHCSRLNWSWWVGKPQAQADLHVKGKDDVAAAVYVLFGDPGFLRDRPVPTLKYVWTNQNHRVGEVISGPYHKEFIRTIVLRNRKAPDEKMVIESVTLKHDFLKAFGTELKNDIHGVAIFTDNDDTGEPIVAHYGKIELLCLD